MSQNDSAPAPENDIRVSLIDLLGSLSGAMDLVSPAVVDHHKRVAYLAVRLGAQLGLPRSDVDDLLLAGLVHDVGAFHDSLDVRLDTLRFETDQVFHAEAGYRLLLKFPGFTRIARAVRWHHTRFADVAALDEDPRILDLAGIIHLADRVDASCRRDQAAASQVPQILERVAAKAGSQFDPEHTEALRGLAGFAGLWQDLDSPELFGILRGLGAAADRMLGLAELSAFTALFSQIIDFRSRFTATHSRGVAATAVALCNVAGFDGQACELMRVAGDLHDLGKLAVPASILEKPGKLAPEEYARVMEHASHTHKILGQVRGLEMVKDWAASHHERLDGKGYPFGLDKRGLELGARIMAVADVFTALTEDRPYRLGMSREGALAVLRDMVHNRSLDSAVVGLLLEEFEAVNAIRQEAQAQARAEFESFALGG
ncbi:MAG: HD domain-containing phosphohydrolase [Thermodesulfobacteriota bacterium]